MTSAAGWPDFLANPGVFAAALAEAAPHERSFLEDRFGADDFGRWAAEKRARAGRAPAIVALHCHGGVFRWGREKVLESADPDLENPVLRRYRQTGYGGRGYANALAQRGYVVAVIDAFYFGERRLRYRHGEWPEAYRAAEAALQPESEEWLKLLDRIHQETMPRVA